MCLMGDAIQPIKQADYSTEESGRMVTSYELDVSITFESPGILTDIELAVNKKCQVFQCLV